MRHPSTGSKYSSKLARLQPPSVSPISLDYGLPVHLQTRSIVACNLARSQPPSASPNSLDYCLQVRMIMASTSAYLQTHTITASKCISKLARLQPPEVHLQTPSISISECISKFTLSRPLSVSPNTLDYRLQVHLQSRSITALECISEFTRSSFSGAPRIALKRRLQPIQIYSV